MSKSKTRQLESIILGFGGDGAYIIKAQYVSRLSLDYIHEKRDLVTHYKPEEHNVTQHYHTDKVKISLLQGADTDFQEVNDFAGMAPVFMLFNFIEANNMYSLTLHYTNGEEEAYTVPSMMYSFKRHQQVQRTGTGLDLLFKPLS